VLRQSWKFAEHLLKWDRCSYELSLFSIEIYPGSNNGDTVR
jgi:hypothetical protein